ncbi:MAG: PQQ-binding-like beta-propeller repeat protein [Actinobacteria bacterium]|nr:PQQ-binding-like beta-propeller repeat protein [Actinomycetota bacterium]
MTARRASRPRSRAVHRLVVLVAVAGVLAGCGADDMTTLAPDGGRSVTTTTETGTDPTDVEGWPSPGRDLSNSRAATDSSISSSTIGRLAEAWRVAIPGPGAYGNASSTPLVVGDAVIVQDLSSTVRSIDLVTGEVRWTRQYDEFSIGPNGPAVGDGLVFAVKGSDDVVALDLDSGAEVWTRRLTATETDGLDIQPQTHDGLVYVSTVPISVSGQYTGGDRGVLYALDTSDGSVRWSFDTVKGDDLWGNPEVNSGGGAWFTPAIDSDTGTIYWGVANPAPFPGTAEFPNGSSRPGPNLYTDSVVALDAATGELRWYHQAIEHDIFDRDLIHTLVVEDDRIEGGKVVVATGKLGRILGLDPETGELRWDVAIGMHSNDDLEALDGPTTVMPGTFGGVLTPPAAADGVVYAATLNAPSELTPDEPHYIGSQLGLYPGTMVAVDAADGTVLWSVEIDGDPLGGATVVGDLVLTGTQEGLLIAFDRETGAEVWREQAPGGLNGWPAVVDDTILWPIGSADPPALVAYRLDA